MLYQIFYKVFKQVLLKIRIKGWRNVFRNLAKGEPLIFVSNHLGSFGPLSVITSLPLKLYPWVAHEVTDRRKCAQRIREEFTEAELRFKPPWSVWLAKLIGRICVAIMKDIEAIPVYANSRRIRDTLQRSLELLLKGKHILVFPEDSQKKLNEVFDEFCTGFLSLARLYYQKTKKVIAFLPVAVNHRVKGIKIGKPIRFNCRVPFAQEKRRLKGELQDAIYSQYYDLEEELRQEGFAGAR